jgi:hypothetical protein
LLISLWLYLCKWCKIGGVYVYSWK